MFDQLLESARNKPIRSKAAMVLSSAFHCVVLGAVLATPLVFYAKPPSEEPIMLSPPLLEPPAPPPEILIEGREAPKLLSIDETVFSPPMVPEEVRPPDSYPIRSTIDGTLKEPVPEAGISPGVTSPGLGVFPSGRKSSSAGPPPPPRPQIEPPSRPLPIGGQIRPPQLIHRVDPVYPRPAKMARIGGKVELRAVIDIHGQVEELTVLDGPLLLRESALQAVKQWRYTPTLLNGKPVPVVFKVSVVYRLR